MNLIPKRLPETGDYNCTWGKQEEAGKRAGLDQTGAWLARDAMQHRLLFEDDYFHRDLPEEDRCGMYLVLDDGWDIPMTKDIPAGSRPFGAVDLDPVKFPGYGDTPARRLKTLNDNVKALGYAGTGLWIPTEQPNEPSDRTLAGSRAYWEECAERCAEAGIRYWKIDWGRHCTDCEYREMMTEVLHRIAPDILVEHAFHGKNGFDQSRDPVILEKTRTDLAVSDAYRLMDCSPADWNTVGISRAHLMLSARTEPKLGTKGMLQGEDCYVLCAVMGFTTGVLWPFPETRIPLIWHRLAPPFSVYEADYRFSEETIEDSALIDDPHHWLFRQEMRYYHPAVMARGCALPEVQPVYPGIPPTVCCSRNPRTGVSSLGVFPRRMGTMDGTPPADIVFDAGDVTKPVGLFGRYRSVTLRFDEPIPDGARIVVQNLFDEEAQDVTDAVKTDGRALTLDGTAMQLIWAASPRSQGVTSQIVAVL